MLFRCYSYGIYESKWHVRRLRRNCINIRYLIAVLCRMFPSSLREGNEIVHQSHKVGACPPPRLKTFLPGKWKVYSCSLLSQAVFYTFKKGSLSYSSTLFGTTIVPVHLQAVGQNVVVTTLSSGRMSSRTFYCSLHYHGACLQGVGQKRGRHHNILREDELATYPQGG